MGPEEHLWGISDPICLVFLFIIFAYLILMEAYVGWTIGKRILGMRVLDRNSNKIGFSKSVSRYPRASPWHFITQASLDLNPGVPGTQRTSVSSLLQSQQWIQNTPVTILYSLSNICF